jgi:hypothetical protein
MYQQLLFIYGSKLMTLVCVLVIPWVMNVHSVSDIGLKKKTTSQQSIQLDKKTY